MTIARHIDELPPGTQFKVSLPRWPRESISDETFVKRQMVDHEPIRNTGVSLKDGSLRRFNPTDWVILAEDETHHPVPGGRTGERPAVCTRHQPSLEDDGPTPSVYGCKRPGDVGMHMAVTARGPLEAANVYCRRVWSRRDFPAWRWRRQQSNMFKVLIYNERRTWVYEVQVEHEPKFLVLETR